MDDDSSNLETWNSLYNLWAAQQVEVCLLQGIWFVWGAPSSLTVYIRLGKESSASGLFQDGCILFAALELFIS